MKLQRKLVSAHVRITWKLPLKWGYVFESISVPTRCFRKQGLFPLVLTGKSTALFCVFRQNTRPKTIRLLKDGVPLVGTEVLPRIFQSSLADRHSPLNLCWSRQYLVIHLDDKPNPCRLFHNKAKQRSRSVAFALYLFHPRGRMYRPSGSVCACFPSLLGAHHETNPN